MTSLFVHQVLLHIRQLIFLMVLAGLLSVTNLALETRPASAQEFNFIQKIVNPRLIIERNRAVSNVVNKQVGKRLAPAASGGTMSGLAVAPTGALITPTADDASSATAATSWNIWLDGSYTGIEDRLGARAYDSDQYAVSTGFDHQLTERILVGALFNYSESDTTNIFVPATSGTDNYSVGPYLGITVTDNIVFDASFLYTWSDNAARSGGVLAAYDGESWNVNANVTGYWFFDSLRVSPKVGFSYSRSSDESYTDSGATFFAGEVTQTGTLNFGTTLAYTFQLGGGRTVEPYLTAEAEWEFLEKVTPNVATGLPEDKRDFDIRLESGVDISLAKNVSLGVNGSIGGLARSRYRSLSGGGRLTFSF